MAGAKPLIGDPPRRGDTRLTRKDDGVPARSQALVASGYGRRDWLIRRLLALADVVGISTAIVLALIVTGTNDLPQEVAFGLATLPAWVILFKSYGLYDRDSKRLRHSSLDDIPGVFHSLLLGCLLLWCWFAFVAPEKLVFTEILLFGAFALVSVLVDRSAVRAAFARFLPRERVLLIGTGQASGALVDKMRSASADRLEPIGMLTSKPDARAAVTLPCLGSLGEVDLPALMSAEGVGRVVVADSDVEDEQLLDVLRDCKTIGVKVSLQPATFSALGPSVEVDDLQGVTVLGINPPVLSRSSRVAKRTLDLAGASLMSLLAVPLLAVLAVAIRVDSRGPVLFGQERIGIRGRRFQMFKLRTMVTDAEAQRTELLAQSKDPAWLHLDDDPRITRMGRLLRLASLDELPQLWNVLKGDMSLVGPRPLVAEEDEMVDGWARGRLDLTPGITGLWQVLGRTNIPFDEMVRLDYLYVTNWSLWGDIRLILRTLPVVLRRSGAN